MAAIQSGVKNAYAVEADQETPKVCIGIGGSFGYYNVHHLNEDDGHMKWDYGLGYGGGIVFERMFTDTFGLHSGLWFSHFTLKLKYQEKETDEVTESKIKSNFITLPLYLITSFSSRVVVFNILTGLNFSYIAESYMKPAPDSDSESSENIKKYLGYGQIGAGAGFEFQFKITKFTRIFIICSGDYYFKNLIEDNEDSSIDHLYSANIRAGFMLCTF